MNQHKLELLLVPADDPLSPLCDGLERTQPSRAPRPEARPATDHNSNWDEGKDPNDLAEQGWGIIAPKGPDGDRLLDLAAPLIARRQRQLGDREVSVFRVSSAAMTMAEAARWKKHRFRKSLELDDHLPRYQLILGDLDQVPLAVQQAQATDGFVGRLAFDRDDDYRSYINKLLTWERQPHPAECGHALLHSVIDGTRATAQGHRALMVPCRDWLERRRQLDDRLKIADIRARDDKRPSPEQLLALADCDRPSVLMSLSHGLGSPPTGWSPERQRREQGALSFGSAGALTGADIGERSFLSGGVWFLFACYGAGTPSHSAYHHWLDTLRRLGHVARDIGHVLDTLARDRPFVAAVPKAALANPRGPLAVLGHIDLAWSYSFQDLDDGVRRRPGRFLGVLRSLLRRDRAGLALRELTRSFEQVNTELTALYDAHASADRARLDDREYTRRAHLWMLRQDLAGYVLLGDPAARLALGPLELDLAGEHLAAEAPECERLLKAVEELLGQRRSLAELARAYRLDPRQIERSLAAYRAAGRRALTETSARTDS